MASALERPLSAPPALALPPEDKWETSRPSDSPATWQFSSHPLSSSCESLGGPLDSAADDGHCHFGHIDAEQTSHSNDVEAAGLLGASGAGDHYGGASMLQKTMKESISLVSDAARAPCVSVSDRHSTTSRRSSIVPADDILPHRPVVPMQLNGSSFPSTSAVLGLLKEESDCFEDDAPLNFLQSTAMASPQLRRMIPLAGLSAFIFAACIIPVVQIDTLQSFYVEMYVPCAGMTQPPTAPVKTPDLSGFDMTRPSLDKSISSKDSDTAIEPSAIQAIVPPKYTSQPQDTSLPGEAELELEDFDF